MNPDPSQRITISEIRAHPWFTQIEHSPPYTPAIFIGKQPIPIDDKIIAVLEKDHHFERAKVEENLQRNKFNNFTTTYYLLLKRKERAGIFRQQYNEDVKKLLQRKKPAPKAIAETRPKEVQMDNAPTPAVATAEGGRANGPPDMQVVPKEAVQRYKGKVPTTIPADMF